MSNKALFSVYFVILAGLICPSVSAQNKSTLMTNHAHGISPKQHKVVQPIAYFSQKQAAITYAKAGKWLKASKLLTSLTTQYPYDGATWYLLGLSYFNSQQWQQAIAAFQHALNLGYRLSGIPTGASNPNDLMVKIAKAYAHLKQHNKVYYWLKKALRARWDDKPTLAGRSLFKKGIDSAFQSLSKQEAFQKISGKWLPEGLTRDEKWQFDLAYLVSEIERMHVNRYHFISKEAFAENVMKVHQGIPSMSDQQIVFQFMRLLGLLGNGHNLLIPAWGKHGSFSQLPLQFYHFKDGLFVVRAKAPYQHLLGQQITHIGNTPIAQAIEKVAAINARDNDMQQLWLAPWYLSLPDVLVGLNIINTEKHVPLTLKKGKHTQQLNVAVTHPLRFTGFPKLPPAKLKTPQLGLDKNNQAYWYQYDPSTEKLYIQFNDVRNATDQSFLEFNHELKKLIVNKNIDFVVLDLRHNSGGNGSLTPPMVSTLTLFEGLRPQGKLFVAMGRNTFSAGHDLLVDITRFTNAILVGEPSGTRPNALGESGWFNLPFSQHTGLISTQFHQRSSAEDHRIWLAPDIPIDLYSYDYFAGKDSVLAGIDKLITNKSKAN